jgi:HEAT repeat protein
LTREAHKLIEQLHSDRIEEREIAAKKLQDLGPAAIDPLESAGRDGDSEFQARIRRVVSVIRTRQKLSANLVRALPGLDERLAVGTPQDWVDAFLDATAEVDRKARYPKLRREDIDVLLEGALAGAKRAKDQKELCRAISRWHVSKGAQGVARYLGDSDHHVRAAAIEALGDLGDPTLTVTLVGFLKDRDEDVQTKAYWALATLRGSQGLPMLRTLMGDRDPEVRRKAVSLLGAFEDKESVPDLVRLLSDEAPLVRANAALALSGIQAKEQIPAVAALLRDSEPRVRGLAAAAIKGLNAKELIPQIAALLRDEEGTVRFYAAECLAEWGAVDQAEAIASLLKDPWELVRIGALGSLERLRSPKCKEAIAAALADPQAGVRCAAIEALASAGDAPDLLPRIRKLLKDPESLPRHQAATMLARFGDPEGVPVLLEKDGDFQTLNALRRPAEWRSVDRSFRREFSGTVSEILEQLCQEVGLRLDLSGLTPADRDTWLSDRRALRAVGGVRTVQHAIFVVLWPRASWILEEKALRVLPEDDARQFWQGWWAKRENK